MIAVTQILPMRPTPTGEHPTYARAQELATEYVIQPKLNGDRVLVTKEDGTLVAWNRLGRRYSFSIHSLTLWNDLPDGVTLDGESWQGRFYPFEAVNDLPVEERIAEAKRLCRVTGNPWIFDEPAEEYYRLGEANLPQWEGIVAKKRGSKYTPIKKSWHESPSWYKYRW